MESQKTTEEFMVPLYHVELVRDRMIPYRSVVNAVAAAEVFHEMLDSSPVEKMAVIHCNSGMKMIGAEIVAMGSHEMVSAQVRDIMRGAILNNAASIWVAHNHVSGLGRASLPDYNFTIHLMEACSMIQLPLNDHLVISPNEYYSVKEHQDELEREVLMRESANALRDLFGDITFDKGGFPQLPPEMALPGDFKKRR